MAHNDLVKEANWLVLADGSPGLIDFQLAVAGDPHSRILCLLARKSWLQRLWFAIGKPVYRLVARRLLQWEDNEGRGPRA